MITNNNINFDSEELNKIKNIINTVISLLEDNINNIRNSKLEFRNEQKELLNFLIGNKENVVSIITKLSNLLIKFNNLKSEDKNNEDIELDSIDFKLIKQYLEDRENQIK